MSNQIDLTSIEEFNSFIGANIGAAVYFSTPECSVCKVLKPKVIELLRDDFPRIKFAYVDCNTAKELAAQKSIFSVPTILFYFDGKEFIRKSRNINMAELHSEISRPYSMIF